MKSINFEKDNYNYDNYGEILFSERFTNEHINSVDLHLMMKFL